MIHIIKTCLILATFLLGVVFSDGKGEMRNGNKANGPSNLPLQEPGITDKLANVTDAKLINLKNILQYLPPVEQDLIADCSATNADATRLVSPDCYKSNFTGVVRIPQSKGLSDVFTNSSLSNRQGLGCLKKIADVYGNANDTTTTTINADITSAVAQQIPLNQATSTFITTVLNVLNARRKFFLTTSNVLNESISGYDAQGYATGFVYNKEDQTTIVSAFTVYANFIYNYFSTLNTKVSNIQGLVGQLNACQSSISTNTTNTSTDTTTPTNTTTNTTTPTNITTNTTAKRFLEEKDSNPKSGKDSSSNSGKDSNSTSGKDSNSESKSESGKDKEKDSKPRGGKEKDNEGRPKTEIPQNIQVLTTNISTTLTSKTGSWDTLRTEMDTNLNPTSGYKPKGDLVNNILKRVNSDAYTVLNKEFSKYKRSNEPCSNDYLYYCRDGACDCADSNCPAEVSAIKTISLTSSVSDAFKYKDLRYLDSGEKSDKLSSSDIPTAYLICSVCLSGKRYTYGQATFPIAGNLIDLADASGNDLGKENDKHHNDCANALASGTNEEKVKCRGEINDDCGKKMDKACGETGLYNFLVNNPLPQSAVPAVCDDTLSNYSESDCFNWLAPKITKATIVFDYRGFLNLPKSIAASFTTVRMLQSDAVIKVVTKDPVQLKDLTAIIPTTVAQIDNSEISVDGATVTAAPAATEYMTQLSQTTATVNLGESFVSMSLNFLILIAFALLI